LSCPRAHRMGDCNNSGGCITEIPQSSVYINNRLAAVEGAIGTSHDGCPLAPIHCHGAWQTANGSGSVYIENIPAVREGDIDTCGHARIAGSDDVFIGG